jgi:hypothetical protein
MDAQLDTSEHKRCKYVINMLTKRQREVLRAFTKGLTRQEVADQLGISKKTVDTFKTIIFDHCREAWDLPSDEPRDHSFLKEHFAAYFDSDEYTPTTAKTTSEGVLKFFRKGSDVL